MAVALSEDIQLKLSQPQKDILKSRQQINLFLAGQGAGKTFLMGVIAYYLLSTFRGISIFIGANTHLQLTDSTLKGIFKVWKTYFRLREYNPKTGDGHYTVNVIPPPHFDIDSGLFTNWYGKIAFSWGSYAYIGSLENAKAHDGKEFAAALLDEVKDTRETSLKEVILGRLREQKINIDAEGKLTTNTTSKPFNPLYIFTSPAKVDWLNEMFGINDYIEEIYSLIFSETTYFKKAVGNKFVTISSTYHNQPNLPSNYIENQKANLNTHLQDMLIYGSPIAKSGGEFIHQFKRLQHVKKLEFNPAYPIHLTFDFNVAPYMSALAAQYITNSPDGRKKLRFIKEYALKAPRNTTEDVCSQFATDYGHELRGLYYYGDPSGRNRQTVSKEYTDNFDVIERKLRKFLNNQSDRVLTAHPSVLKSRDFMNNLFAGVYGIDIEIDESCKQFIYDLEFAKEDVNGAMVKPKTKDPITGQTYEKLGHHLDGSRYLAVPLFSDLYEKM